VHADRVLVAERLADRVDAGQRDLRGVERVDAQVGRAARVRGVVPRDEGFLNLADLRPSGILSGFKQEELRLLERVQHNRARPHAPTSTAVAAPVAAPAAAPA